MSLLSKHATISQVTRAAYNMAPINDIDVKLIEAAGIKTPFIVPVGSRVTCSPPPMDTDEDFLVLTSDMDATLKNLQEFGFELDTTSYSGSTRSYFHSLRCGTVNYIVTTNPEWYDAFLTATYICKRLNVLDKTDRIAIFEAVMCMRSFADKMEEKWTYKSKRVEPDVSVSGPATASDDFDDIL